MLINENNKEIENLSGEDFFQNWDESMIDESSEASKFSLWLIVAILISLVLIIILIIWLIFKRKKYR